MPVMMSLMADRDAKHNIVSLYVSSVIILVALLCFIILSMSNQIELSQSPLNICPRGAVMKFWAFAFCTF